MRSASRETFVSLSQSQKVIAGDDYATKFLEPLASSPGLGVVVTSVGSRGRQEVTSLTDRFLHAGWQLHEMGPGEPDFESALSSFQKLEDVHSVRIIVAIGGGSVIDEAKMLATYLLAPEVLHYRGASSIVRVPKSVSSIDLVAVPTTIGSGSESSSSSLLISKGSKVALVGDALIPSVAVLDPKLVLSAPSVVLAAGILDSIAHIIEGILSTIPSFGLFPLASQALRTAVEFGERATSGDIDAVRQLQLVGNTGGLIQDKLLSGPVHMMAHQFRDIPHGSSVGWLSKSVFRLYLSNFQEVGDSFRHLLTASGVLEDVFFEFLMRMLRLTEIAPQNFEAGFNDLDLDKVLADPSSRACPVQIDSKFVDFVRQDLIGTLS